MPKISARVVAGRVGISAPASEPAFQLLVPPVRSAAMFASANVSSRRTGRDLGKYEYASYGSYRAVCGRALAIYVLRGSVHARLQQARVLAVRFSINGYGEPSVPILVNRYTARVLQVVKARKRLNL